MSEANDSLAKLEAELRAARLHGARAVREMQARLAADLTDAELRAKQADKRARQAERSARQANRAAKEATRRAREAEHELEAVRRSATWRAGRAVVAVPARLRRLGRG